MGFDGIGSGMPLNVQGRSVGAFCLLGITKPPGFGPADLELQRSMCARVELALEQHLQQKQQQSQQAMMMACSSMMQNPQMQQMMLMQQQQMMMMMQQQQGAGMAMAPGMMKM